MIEHEKANLRLRFAALRRALPAAEKAARDAAIIARIRALPEYRAAAFVSVYAADRFEPEILPLIGLDPEKKFMIPRYAEEIAAYEFALIDDVSSLVPGRYGLREAAADCPVAPSEAVAEAALYLVPGLAFDPAGVRLGRGGGFFDRLLAGVRSPVCGVFYAAQGAEQLPALPHDRRTDLVVTEKNVFRMNELERLKG
jgi:5-formyltetrahydrofolate cyclo-ligase